MKPFGRIIVFSLIETVTVVVWAAVLKLGTDLSLGTKVAAFAVLLVGYVVEHLAAWNAAKNRPLLSFPPED